MRNFSHHFQWKTYQQKSLALLHIQKFQTINAKLEEQMHVSKIKKLEWGSVSVSVTLVHRAYEGLAFSLT